MNTLLYKHIRDELFCFTCDLQKPSRTRHCKKCRRCVRRFDHHCPWTGNCVGISNGKYFIQFLFYASFTLLLFAVFQVTVFFLVDYQTICYFWVLKDVVKVVISDSTHTTDGLLEVSDIANLWIIFSMVSGFLLGFSIGYLFVYQISNLKINLTTVEEMITTKVKQKSPFDRGSLRYVYYLLT